MLCHKKIRKIAKEIAGAAYNELALEDIFYEAYPSQTAFITRHWKNYIPQARNSLLQILSGNYPDSMKEECFEIILQDRTLQAVNDLQAQGTA